MYHRGILTYKCLQCGKCSPDLKHCSFCQRATYCDRNCQLADWSQHKIDCQEMASEPKFAEAKKAIVGLSQKFYVDLAILSQKGNVIVVQQLNETHAKVLVVHDESGLFEQFMGGENDDEKFARIVMYKKKEPIHQLFLSLNSETQDVSYEADDEPLTKEQQKFLRQMLDHCSTKLRCFVWQEKYGNICSLAYINGYYCCTSDRTAKEDEKGIEHFMYVTTEREEMVNYVQEIVEHFVKNQERFGSLMLTDQSHANGQQHKLFLKEVEEQSVAEQIVQATEV